MSDLSTPSFSVTDLDKIIHALLPWVPQDAQSYAAKVAEWSSLSVEERSFNMMMGNVGVIAAVRLSIAAQHVVGSATADGLTILGEGVQEGTQQILGGTQQILGELRGLVAEVKRAVATSRASTRTTDDAKPNRRVRAQPDASAAAQPDASVRAQPDASAAAQPAAQQGAT